jgi:hypothetical protein
MKGAGNVCESACFCRHTEDSATRNSAKEHWSIFAALRLAQRTSPAKTASDILSLALFANVALVLCKEPANQPGAMGPASFLTQHASRMSAIKLEFEAITPMNLGILDWQ